MHRGISRRQRRCHLSERLFRIVQGSFTPSAGPLASIYCNPPRDSRQPRLRVFDTVKLRAVTQDAQERFLRCVLGVMAAAQHRIGDSIYKPRLLPDQFFEHLICVLSPTPLSFAAFNRPCPAQNCLSRRHSSVLDHEDCSVVEFVQEFLRRNDGKGRACSNELPKASSSLALCACSE